MPHDDTPAPDARLALQARAEIERRRRAASGVYLYDPADPPPRAGADLDFPPGAVVVLLPDNGRGGVGDGVRRWPPPARA
jgi:hypothetical protein